MAVNGGRRAIARRPPCHQTSVCSAISRAIDLDSQVANRAFQLCVSEQQLHRLEVLRPPVDLLNPKMALFVLALFPQFVRPQDGAVAVQILTLATVLNLIGLIVNGVVILSASQLSQRWASRRRQSRVPQYLLASVFAGLAARLAIASRT